MPKGLISVYRITADTPIREIKEHTIVLKFKMRGWGDSAIDSTELATMLQYVLRDWSDGRYCFEAEMINNGLSRCLDKAVYESICKEMQDKYGREIVPHTDGNGHTSRWYLEAIKEHKKREKPWFVCEPEVEIE